MADSAVRSLRVVRRPKGSSQRSLTAASQPIDEPSKQLRSSIVGSRENWQEKAWDALDLVGELRYYVSWRANASGRVRLVASDIDPETGLPTGSTENARVQAIIRQIAGGVLAQSQLIKRAVECLTVPGECWVVILMRDDGPVSGTWLALSRDEIKDNGRTVTIELPSGKKHEFVQGVDSMFRVWNPRPRKASEPDSPVRATLDPLHEIIRTTKTISNASKSRLIGNGVVFVPQQMSLPSVNPPVAQDKPGVPVPALVGTPAVQQLQDLLFQVAQTAYDDEDSMAALIPIFVGADGEQVKNVSHLKFDNSVTDIAIKTRNDAIARLAMGLDVSPERLLGLGSTTNHWSAWQIGDEDVQLHIVPVMQTLCQAINDQVLRNVFLRNNIDPDKYMLWFDAGQLTADPDKADEATAAFDRGAINGEAYRDFLGLGADSGYDFSTLEGWQMWAQDQVSKKPELFKTFLPLLDSSVSEIEFPSNTPPALEGQPPPEQQQAPQQEPQTENNPPPEQTPPAQTASVRGRDQVESAVIELLVSRALEMAGKRRRTHADHARLRDVPIHETHRFMPPVADEQVSKLIEGWDASLAEDTLALLNMDIDTVRAAVKRAVREELTRQVVDA